MTTRRGPRYNRREFENQILADLFETSPTYPIPLPDPYNENLTLEQNLTNLYSLMRNSLRTDRRIEGLVYAYYIGQYIERYPVLPDIRINGRKFLTKHYTKCCTYVHDIFSIVGIEQLYRTKRSIYWMFGVIKKPEFKRLINEAEGMLTMM